MHKKVFPVKISSVQIFKLNIELSQSTRTPIGSIVRAKNVIVKVISSNGDFGWGEASPFPMITGDSQDTNFLIAEKLARLIKDRNPLAIEDRLNDIKRLTVGEPSIRSSFDMALYDLAAKAAGMPLFQFLGGESLGNGMQRTIRTDLTIGLQESVEETLTHAKAILDNGFDAIKMKVGRPGLEDVPHVAAVRELAGPDVAIKIDSNQGWDYPTAVANINAMAPLNLLYSEQPLAVWDFDNLARLRNKVDLPICADESVFDDKDASKLVKAGAADYLNIKLGKSGGIHTALKINAIAEAAGCKCMIGCFSESRLALSAAAHLAMARPNIVFIDLDSAYKHKDDPVVGGISYDKNIGGLIHIPDTPGHGAEFHEDYLKKCEHVTV